MLQRDKPVPNPPMRLLLRRLIAAVPVLFCVSILAFTLLASAPGDSVLARLGPEADPTAIATLRHQSGLDQPAPLRFVRWLAGLARGDLGRSSLSGQKVAGLIAGALGPTLELAAAALAISVLLGLPAGVAAAARRNTWGDLLGGVAAWCGLSMPAFWLGTLLVLGVSLRLGWLPASGHADPLTDLPEALRCLALPALTLGLPLAAATFHITRSAVLEVLPADHIRAARARGLSDTQVVWRHALGPALAPVVTLLGLQIGQSLGGVVVTETVFAWPGLGRLLVDAILARDAPVVSGAVLAVGLLFAAATLAAELLADRLDPRRRDGA